MAREELARGAGVALFAAATVTKAWEPLSVAYAEDAGRHRFLFATALVLCECAKLVATATPLLARRLRGDPAESAAWLVSARSARAFGPPALMLAFTNHLLGVGVVLLDPLVYQVLFRVISVVFTAALSSLVLRRELRGAQKLALLLLLLGFYLALPGSGEPRHGPKLGGASAIGLMATACGAASFSLQAVWFEAATVAPGARQSTLTQTTALALWGVVANGLLLVALHGPALLAARRSPLVGFTEREHRRVGPGDVGLLQVPWREHLLLLGRARDARLRPHRLGRPPPPPHAALRARRRARRALGVALPAQRARRDSRMAACRRVGQDVEDLVD